jgi:hypothetical protein
MASALDWPPRRRRWNSKVKRAALAESIFHEAATVEGLPAMNKAQVMPISPSPHHAATGGFASRKHHHVRLEIEVHHLACFEHAVLLRIGAAAGKGQIGVERVAVIQHGVSRDVENREFAGLLFECRLAALVSCVDL